TPDMISPMPEGWQGWDAYAAYYDWENARTVGRRDVAFWREFAGRHPGPVLELGCGTGRIAAPLARAGLRVVGLDRSAPMLAHAFRRRRRLPLASRPHLVRGDIRSLPFPDASFGVVLAPYGILQSLLSDDDVRATLSSAARVLTPGGRLGIDLVPDVPRWREYRNRVTMRGHHGKDRTPIALVESVEQDRARGLTVFHHEYREGRGAGAKVARFTVTFRTLPVPLVRTHLEEAGFDVDVVLGDYQGRPVSDDADSWILLATRRPGSTRRARTA
ncbi:MAG: methyltransferase domain-containing protein, partial [Vicinamibacteraceae bacterium]|nr:methyltransferase domain-containing protein [Vicinamibacteraceae bacterium]